MSVTIKDVAKAAGVSHTTVSRALRDNPAIASATTANIKKLANEMGYVPNHVARGLKMRRSGVLGVIVRRVDDPFFGEVIDGIEDVIRAAGYSLFLSASHNDPRKDREIIASMIEQRVDGVINCSTSLGTDSRQRLTKLGIPTVLVNNQATDDAEYAIYHDDTHGSCVLTQHLIDLGHTDIAYIGNTAAGLSNHQRQLGYQVALTEASMIVRPEYIATSRNGWPNGGSEAVQQLLTTENRPTAIVCYNDLVAMGVIHHLTMNGLHIPEDCSVTGFDNIPLAAYLLPSLTTFDQPTFELGKKSAELLLHQLSYQNGHNSTIKLRGELVIRHSTAPPS